MTTISPTIFALRQGWQDFRSAWKAATGFLHYNASLDWALLSPLIAWGREAIVRSGGAVAITNADLTGFALSLPGIAFLFTVGTVQMVLLRIRVGGLTLLAAEVTAGRRPPLLGCGRRQHPPTAGVSPSKPTTNGGRVGDG